MRKGQKSLFRTAEGPTKKQILAQFIKTNGPMLRKDLIEKSGLKEGTLASALNDKKAFQQLPDKRWDLVQD